MLEIINEFFSKDSKIRNITIEELLEEYEIEEVIFWNYVYERNLTIVAKIKEENKKRKENKNSIEIYRLTKDGNSTFGDIARKKNITIEQVVTLLQNDYLNGIANYSFDAINKRNTELLRKKKEFQLYFYFMEHTVTFEQLGNQFHLEEAQIIYYFDSVLDSELTPKQIKHVFTLNKKRESPYEYYKNHFILFRDLGVLLKKDQKSLEQYNQKQPDKWKKISEIEAKRKSIIQMNRAILIQFAELINELTNDMQNKTTYIDKILDQFSNHIKNPSMMLQLKVQNQPSYFKTLVRSAQFIALYLEQESYSTKNLIEMFQIKSRATERLYLYHPFVFQLLNEEVQQYIKTKREIAHLNGLQKKQEAYLQNKSYQKVARNAHGQFTKK